MRIRINRWTSAAVGLLACTASTIAAEENEAKELIRVALKAAERVTMVYPRDHVIDCPPFQTKFVELNRSESRTQLDTVLKKESLHLDEDGSKLYRERFALPEKLRAEFPRPCVLIVERSSALPLFVEVYAAHVIVNRSLLLRLDSGEDFYRSVIAVGVKASEFEKK